MRVAIIDYGSGNLRSATKAFERAAREAGISAEIDLTDKAERVSSADRIVLPGVGAYADCRRGLDAVPGMVEALRETVEAKARPFLGICVGMQLMSSRGLEKTTTQGLGWIKGDVVKMEPSDQSLKIPQIGWNTLDRQRVHPLFEGIPETLHAYFVHSYHLAAENPDDVVEKKAHPFLGICVGMQLMSSRGLEKTTTEGLGWIRGDVVKMTPSDPDLKIPQIGWNTLDRRRTHPLFDGIPETLHAYFVHSYHLAAENPEDVVATVGYGGAMTAFVADGNKAGAQFHPEKSQSLGLALITNFLRWKP